MRFGVLGPLTVWSSDANSVTIRGLKVRALLADLLINEGRPVSADRLIDDLWADDLPGHPAGALQAKVSQLRRALEEGEPGGRELVESTATGYRLRVAADAVDAGRFTRLIAQARERADAQGRAGLLTEALALWRGSAYGEVADAEFARGAITRLDEQWLTALEDLAEARQELGEHSLLVSELGDLVALHPLRERLRAAQMRALYASGRQTEALDSYADLRDRLRSELGLEPGPELAALQQAILRQDADLSPASAAIDPLPRRTGNLPSPMSTGPDGGLVGRSELIKRVGGLLDETRLVTLTGPGGVGKTRLAIESARAVSANVLDGAWIVDLTAQERKADSADAVSSIASDIASVLGTREDSVPGLPDAHAHLAVTDRLAEALRSKQLLLVLDNCEHVVEPAARLAEQLLEAAADLRILITSREPLGLSTEVVLPVPTLSLPEPDAPPDRCQHSAAVQLFAERAAAASGFALTADNTETVAEICRRLDGIPLALELAAARTRTLGVGELAKRLDDRFGLLTSGHRTAPQRQQTLRAVIDWSWKLLSASEATLLSRLAVHAGGCTLGAVEHLVAPDEFTTTEVIDLLARLIDQSLVTVVDDGPSRRYRLLESVAAYGIERLEEAGELSSVRRRHADYYASLAHRTGPKLRTSQHDAMRHLDSEAANLRVALGTAVDQNASDLALGLVNSLAWYWFLRGRYQEARRSLTVALRAADGDGAHDHARATALTWLAGISSIDYQDDPEAQQKNVLALYEELGDPAGLAFAQWLFAYARLGSGDVTVRATLIDGALAGFREQRDQWGIAAALLTRAEHALASGDLATARRDSNESRDLFSRLGDCWGQVYSTFLLGTLSEIGGDYEQSTRLRRDALRRAEQLQLWPSVSIQLGGLGRLALLAGDFTEAATYHERALRVAEDQSYRLGAAFAKIGLALSARKQGDLDLAEQYLHDLLDWHRRSNFFPGMALILAELGFTAELRGDAETSRAWHTEGLATARKTHDPRAIALALEGLAGVSVLTGDYAHAARLLGAAAAARQSVGAPRPPAERGDVDRISAAAKAALGDNAFDSEFARGARTTVDDLP